MKHFSPKILLLLLVLPLVLAACGGGKADNAKSFIEDLFAGDASKAKENACDALHPSIDIIAGFVEDGDEVKLDDLECKEDGDNVKCTASVDGEEDTLTLIMDDDDKVCGGDIFDNVTPEIPDVEIPDVEIPDVEIPDTDTDADSAG
jgi:hypothetical protein